MVNHLVWHQYSILRCPFPWQHFGLWDYKYSKYLCNAKTATSGYAMRSSTVSILVLAVSVFGPVTAQDLSVPTSWRVLRAFYHLSRNWNPCALKKFSNTRPLAERITISQNAINTILPQLSSATGEFNGSWKSWQVIGYAEKDYLGIGYWQSGNVWSTMANQDHFAGTTTNKAQVINNLKNVFRIRANYDQFGYVWPTMSLYALFS